MSRTGRASPFSETSVSNVLICTGTTLTACASDAFARFDIVVAAEAAQHGHDDDDGRDAEAKHGEDFLAALVFVGRVGGALPRAFACIARRVRSALPLASFARLNKPSALVKSSGLSGLFMCVAQDSALRARGID